MINAYSICCVNLANVMKEPSHKAERHTQLLYGERVELLEETHYLWQKIQLTNVDDFGWILSSQLVSTQNEKSLEILFGNEALWIHKNQNIPILIGSFCEKNDEYILNQSKWICENKGMDITQFKSILLSFLYAPYAWGGLSVYGIDCSGLSKIVYRFLGISLPHEASMQAENFGEPLDFLMNAQIGDLAFFENENGEIQHVGVLLNQQEIIHASESNGKVCIDYIDHEGIIQKETLKRTHRLRIIKRLVEFVK